MKKQVNIKDTDSLYQYLMDACLKFVSIRQRSRNEVSTYIVQKLKKLGTSDIEVKNRVISRLQELNYINDRDFVEWWIDSRSSTNIKGPSAIRMELFRKGISPELIELSLAEAYSLQPDTEYEIAQKLLRKKTRLFSKLPKLQKSRKLYALLSGRGFSGSVIHRIIDEMVEKD